MSTIGFKKYSVIKIYFLFIRDIYIKASEKILKNLSVTSKILMSIWLFLNIIYFSPKLLLKIWKERKEINKALENKFRTRVFELLFDLKKVFPELSEENANYLSDGIGYGFMALMFTEIFPKFQLVSEKLLKNGWFLNNYIKISIKGDPEDSIYSDNFNTEILKKNIKEIENLAITRFPQRSELLKLAFRHHKSKDYASSISLLLPQIDGIFRELTNKELFSKAKNKNPNSWLKGIEDAERFGLIHLFLSPLKEDQYFGANFNEALDNTKFFSRNRILHGEDLDLNNETKSFKVISLLLYITSTVYDAINEDENNPRLKDYYVGMEELKNRLGLN